MKFRSIFSAAALVVLGAVDSKGQATWNGGGGANMNWSDGANWALGVSPTSSFTTTVQFSGAPAYTSVLDSNYDLAQLTFQNGAGAVTLNNSASSTLSISGAMYDYSANAVAINVPLVYSTGSIYVDGTGTLTLGGTGNTYAGTTSVITGGIADANAGAFSPNSGFVVASGAILDVNFNETISYLDNYSGGGGSVVIAGGATLIVNGTSTTTFPGVISGSGGLEKDGSSSLVLTGANTYTGPTVVGSGATIWIGSGGTTGSIASSGVSSTGTGGLLFDLTSAYTYSGTLSGSLGVTQNASGTTTLSGNNTYSGATTVNAGTLQAGSTSAFGGLTGISAVTVGASGTLATGTFSNTIGSLAGSGSVTLGNGATLTIGNTGANTNFSGVISGLGSFSMGGYVQELSGANTYSGGTSVTYGTLLANNTTGSATGTGPITIGPSGTLQIGTVDTSGSINGASAITDNGAISFARTDTTTFANAISGTGGVSQFEGGTTTLSGANTYSGTTQIFLGTLQAGSASAFGGATGLSAISFTNSGTLNLNGFSNTVGSISGAAGNSILLGAATLTLASPTANTTYGGTISGTGGSLVFSGTSLKLQGNNSYTGSTTVTSGTLVADNSTGSATGSGNINISSGATLEIGNADTNGAVAATAITDNGTVEFARTDNITIGSNITGSGGILVQEFGSTVTLDGTNTYSGPTVITNGVLSDWGGSDFSPNSSVQIGTGGSLAVMNNDTVGDLENSGGAGTVTLAPGTTLTIGVGNAALPPFTGIISGSGGLTISTGANSQGFGGANTYTGVTTMSSGEIFVSSSTVGAPGSITSGPIGTNTMVLTGNGEMSSIGASPVTLANAIALGGYNLDNDDATQPLTLTGPITGVGGSITWCTNNALALINSNTFTGGVDMRLGTLLLGSDTAAGTGQITLDNTTVIDAFGSGITRNIANAIYVSSTATQIGEGNDNNLTFTGVISGAGTSVVTIDNGASGSVTLSGTSTISNTTFNVNNGGTVFAANGSAFGSPTNSVVIQGGSTLNVLGGVSIPNPVTVGSGANTLAGSGTFSNSSALPITNYVILSPSASPGGGPGNLTFSSPLIFTGGAIHFQLYDAGSFPGTGWGEITASGGMNFTGATANSITFNVVSVNSTGQAANALNFNPASSYSWTFATSTSITSFNAADFNIITSGFSNGTGGGVFSVSKVGNNLDLNFTPVPEPSTWAMMVLGTAGMALIAWRRRRLKAA